MKPYLSVILILCSCVGLSQTGYLSGKIVDNIDKSPLIGVNIVSQKNQGTTTDLDGNYILKLPIGKQLVHFQYLGYTTQTIEIIVLENDTIVKDLYLKTESTEMDLVVVSAGKFEQKLEQVTVSMDVIKPSLIENKNSADLEIL